MNKKSNCKVNQLDKGEELVKNRFDFHPRTEFWLIFGVVVLCAGILLWRGNKEKAAPIGIAVISYDGEVQMRIDLSSEQDKTFTFEKNPKVQFEIQDHAIRFVHVECPDKLCEKSGFLRVENQTAVCLPNRTTLTIQGSGGDIDAFV